jgi:PAS domain S-box-containing protein
MMTVDIDEGKKAEEQPGFMAQLQAVLNVLPAYTWYGTPSGSLLFVSKRQADFLGVPKDHPLRFGIDIGAPWDSHIPFLHPDDQEAGRKYWADSLRTGEGYEHSYRVRDAQGNYRWLLTRTEPLRASDGTLLLWVGATLDIEELKRTEQALRESEYKLRQIIDTVPSLLWAAGPDGELTHVSQRLLDYSGMRLEDFQRGGWEAFVHPADLPETSKAFYHAIQTGTSYQSVHRLCRAADSEYRWHHARAEPLRDREGRIVQWYGLSVDIDEGKKAEDRLRRSEAYLAEAQRLSHTGTWAFNETTTLYWSEESYRIWGFDPLQGLPSREAMWQRVHPDDRDWVRQGARDARRQKRDYAVEHRIVLPDGTVRYLEATARFLSSGDGERFEVVGTHVDVTERKRAEKALRESEAKIRRLVDANIIGIFIWDFEGRIIEANDAFLRMVGYDREDLASGRLRWTELTPPEWRDSDKRRLAELKLTGSLQPFEKEYFGKDGIRVPVLIGAATFEEGGNQGVAFVLDLTERKRTEQAAEHLASIVESSDDAIVSKDLDGIIRTWNRGAERLFGYKAAEVIGRPITILIPPDRLDEEPGILARIRRGEPVDHFETVRRHKDGSLIDISLTVSPTRDAKGAIVGASKIARDITERKRADEALRQSTEALRRSEAYLAEAQRLSHTGTWVSDGTLTTVYNSEENYRIWGFDPLQGVPSRDAMWQRIHPDDRDRVWEGVQEAVRQKRDYAGEFRIVLPDGTIKYLDVTAHHRFSARGEVVEILRTNVDVTETKRAERALRESEAKFRDYAETASDWFWETGPDYRFTLLTENAFGSDSADRIGTACWDRALDLETEPEKWRVVRATVDSHKPFRDFIYCTTGGDGSPMYVRASGKPMFDANREFRGYRGTGTDVTAITRAQEALRESERSARSALDGIAGLVSVLAPNGEVETANRQLLEYFGRSLEWIKNWGTNDAVHPEDLPRVLEFFGKAMAAGIPFQHELRMRRFDGEYRWFDNRGVPIRDDSGRIARWYILLTDIEDRTRALAQLEQMQSDFAHMNRVSMMGELAGSLSHEITQPIASARNNARAAQNFLDMQPPDLSEVREALSCVVGDTDRAGDIIDRIREHMKKAPPRKGQFDLNEAINEVIVLGRSAIIKNGVWVQTRLSEGLVPIHGDRVQLQQVVLNLILNAVEAMGSVEAKPRDLLISTEQDRTGALVAVRDSGPGIDPSHLERVFDAFYTTKSGGMGMGLSICRSIIEAHGGRLWAEANEPRGTIFQFTLPRS